MRKLGMALGLAAIFGGASFTASASEVGVISWQQALMETTEAQQTLNQLQNELGDRPQQVQSLGEEVQQMQQRLQRDGATMGESERDNLLQELQSTGQQYQQQMAEVEQTREEREQSFMERSGPKLNTAIETVAERHGLDLIIDRSAVVYGLDSVDLTEEVTAAYNEMD